MKHLSIYTYIRTGLFLVLLTFVCACGYDVDVRRRAHIYDLCQQAYRMRYIDLDSCEHLASTALSLSGIDYKVASRALNELAFVRYIRMDYTSAFRLLDSIRTYSNDQLDLVCADVMRMKICQRINDGRQYYDARNQVERRLRRIHQEKHELNSSAQARLLYAESEYHIVNSTYYYYQKLDSASRNEMMLVKHLAESEIDTAQMLNYNYMIGSGGILEGNFYEVLMEEFDKLFVCYLRSRVVSNLYFEANALQSLSTMLIDSSNVAILKTKRPEALSILTTQHLSWIPDSVDERNATDYLPEAFANHALHDFTHYGDKFQCACVYRTLGEICFTRGRYEEALHYYQCGLDIISDYHSQYYNDKQHAPRLYTYDSLKVDTLSYEKRWLQDDSILSLPEWMAGIRQQISLSYSALGNKVASDYNRNIYLDIIECGHQDEELLSLSDELSRQISTLWWTFAIVVFMFLFVIFLVYRYSRYLHRDTIQQMSLRQCILDFCSRLTTSDVDTYEYVIDKYNVYECKDIATKRNGYESVDGVDNSLINYKTSSSSDIIQINNKQFLALVKPYVDFIHRNSNQLSRLSDTLEEVEEQRAIVMHRLIVNKEQNAERRAKVSMVYSIMPFLDRIIAEVDRMKRLGTISDKRLSYIDELTEQILSYNAILTSWIQLSQGQLSMQITTVSLQPIFDTLRRGHFAYDQSGIDLKVGTTDACVKADEALTLFMLNTLADNARKFTPRGGSIEISAIGTDDFIELSVCDTGCGLSEEDVETLNNEKIYDPSKIGIDSKDGKGFGFGLMNCRGIIEKYRKTSTLFGVCKFGVESQKGRGSRFFFRLPRVVSLFLLLLSFINAWASAGDALGHDSQQDPYQLYDSVYAANVEGRYGDGLYFASKAINAINPSFTAFPDAVVASDSITEEGCFLQDCMYDYRLLADLHNEAAISALALCEWDIYTYNNDIYTSLMKYMSQDKSLPEKCEKLQQTRANSKLMLLFLAIFVTIVFVLSYIMLRKKMNLGTDLRQLGEINVSLLTLQEPSEDDNSLQPYSESLLQKLFDGVSQLYRLDYMKLSVCDANDVELCKSFVGAFPTETDLKDAITTNDYPLIVRQTEDDEVQVGMLKVCGELPKDDTLLKLAIKYFTLVIYNAVVRTTQQSLLIQQMEDERNQLSFEENRLHVQNQVLDNCLSTIKHESMYYPSRIQQLSRRLSKESDNTDDISQLYELTHYYKDVYSLLSAQAERQTSQTGFRASRVDVDSLIAKVESMGRRYFKRHGGGLSLKIESSPSLRIRADYDLMNYLFVKLFEGVLSMIDGPDELILRVSDDGMFVRFSLLIPSLSLSDDELHNLFMPQRNNISLLIVKQIVREHDALNNHPGLRMIAERDASRGTCIWFTIPI